MNRHDFRHRMSIIFSKTDSRRRRAVTNSAPLLFRNFARGLSLLQKYQPATGVRERPPSTAQRGNSAAAEHPYLAAGFPITSEQAIGKCNRSTCNSNCRENASGYLLLPAAQMFERGVQIA